ncbi:MAG: hypothetical protein EU541_01995 [Promethearchaeota archaeon]|nr:MAG: hypothetical protein EU541_01995 [Candidatus Lokiarchaeota archaeon]
MNNRYFWDIIKKYNKLMKAAIKGPDCIDPAICRGDCCSIHIDVPKILAEKYIEFRYINKREIIRSNIFAFKLALNPQTYKCVLFDKKINGCSVHNSGIKPPQCWIYPTKFSNPNGKEISCKRVSGWKIIDKEKTKKAEKLLEHYKFLCLLEARNELKLIQNRILRAEQESLIKQIQEFKPSELGGFRDGWDVIEPLSAEGISLQLKKFCLKHNPECKYLPESFMECNQICKKIANTLIGFLKENLYNYIKVCGADDCGEYPFFKLFEFTKFNARNEDIGRKI